MIFQTLKVAAIAVAMMLCTSTLTAQDCGCNGGVQADNGGGYYSERNNCGRAPGYGYASSLWSDYCTDNCTPDDSCKGSCKLFNRGGGGIGGRMGGGGGCNLMGGGGMLGNMGGGCLGNGGGMVSYAPAQTEMAVMGDSGCGCSGGCNGGCGGGDAGMIGGGEVMGDAGMIVGDAGMYNAGPGYFDSGSGGCALFSKFGGGGGGGLMGNRGGGCNLMGNRGGGCNLMSKRGGGGLFSKLRGGGGGGGLFSKLGGGGMFGGGGGGFGGGSCFGWPGQDCCGGGCGGGASFGGGMFAGGGGGGGGLFARLRSRHSGGGGGGLLSRHRSRHSGGGGMFSRLRGGSNGMAYSSPMSYNTTFGSSDGYFDQFVGADYGNGAMQTGMQGYITSGCGCSGNSGMYMPTSVQDANQIGCPNGGCQATPTSYGTMSSEPTLIGTPANVTQPTEFQPATGIIYDGNSNLDSQGSMGMPATGSNEIIGEAITDTVGDAIQDAVNSAADGN